MYNSNIKIDDAIVEAEIIGGYGNYRRTLRPTGRAAGFRGTGNTVIFAHAREGLFNNLKDVKREI